MKEDIETKDTKAIPKGMYCYDENGICPYWASNPDYHYQENGWCAYLERGDWEMNDDKKWSVTYVKEGEPNRKLQSAHELGIPMSLLWDQCKECGINEEEEDGRD
jgi:hypothetical protein